MLIFLIVLIASAALLTLFALLRGLVAFSYAPTVETQRKQTQMMAARVKWQTITVLLVIIVSVVIAL